MMFIKFISSFNIKYFILIIVVYFVSVTYTSSYFSKPNIIIFLADDLGYGDLAVLGHPSTKSSNIDYLFKNGKILTQFYSPSPVCSPSRAALLTGKYPIHTGVWPDVFWPNYVGGLPTNQSTIASYLKQLHYSTALIGKWHLGYGKKFKFHPKHYGFDLFYGIPYSHDMCPCQVCFYPQDACSDECDKRYVNCPLFENDDIISQPVNLTILTKLYTQKALQFARNSVKEQKSFFLLMSYHHTHHPQFSGKMFRNVSRRGSYGDSIEEMDWSIGQLLKAANNLKIWNNTFILFTSDNGPSLNLQPQGGVSGIFSCGKGTTYEGGIHVPTVAFWRNKIQPGSSLALSSMLDILPTVLKLVNLTLPTLDGYDLSDVLFNNSKGLRDVHFFFPHYPDSAVGMYALRYKHYKAHFYTEGSGLSATTRDPNCTSARIHHNPPLLFDIYQDPSENINLALKPEYKKILQQIIIIKKEFEKKSIWYPSEVAKGQDDSIQPCCNPNCEPFPSCCKCEKNQNIL